MTTGVGSFRLASLRREPLVGSRTCGTACCASHSGRKLQGANSLQDVKSLQSTENFLRDFRNGASSQARTGTVYTVRIHTGTERRSGMSDFHAGVQMCLIGEGNRALLHRVCQIQKSSSTKDIMALICEMVGTEGGAACDRPPASAEVASSTLYTQRRFQRGAVDEVSFVGPDLGELKAVVVGPESGAWQLDELTVSNSREALTQRFVCNEGVGTDGTSASLLTPVPPDAIVYGSGEQSVLMTPVQADAARQMGMREYLELKDRIFKTTVVLVATGMAVSGAVGGADAAEAFTVGGAVAFFYQLALTQHVDSLPFTHATAPQPAAQGGALAAFLRGQPPRLLLTGVLMVGALCATQMWDTTSGDDEEVHRLSVIATAVLGFFTYKAAIVAASLAPARVETKSQQSIEH